MSKKTRLILQISVGLNILLIVILAYGYIKMNFAKDQVFLTEVQWNLVELEGLIAYQSDNKWSEPNLVTTELGDVINGIWLGFSNGEQLGNLSNDEREILNKLNCLLSQYPNDRLYSFVDLTQKDKENFEELRQKLRNVGLGLNISVPQDMTYFLNQVEELVKSIDIPLN